jgi:hypothetical protein
MWLLLCFILLHSSFCLCANAQSYSIDWSTIDGGGGTSTGGVYSVSGTIGQPDAGAMSGGNYMLQGGFWSGLTTARPWLRIWIEVTDVVLAWPFTAGACQLQQADNVATPGWSDVSETPVVVGDEYHVTLPLAGFQQFFRLIQL